MKSSTSSSHGLVPGVIFVIAVIGVFPLAFALDQLIGGGRLGSALGAIVIATILAINACMLIGTPFQLSAADDGDAPRPMKVGVDPI
jgi:hypothetical protein